MLTSYVLIVTSLISIPIVWLSERSFRHFLLFVMLFLTLEVMYHLCTKEAMRCKCPFQNKFQLCCTLYQWFLYVEAVGGVCMPTNESSKGGELLATGQLFNSSPNHDHTHPTCLQTSKLCCHCTFCSPNKRSHSPIGVLGPV